MADEATELDTTTALGTAGADKDGDKGSREPTGDDSKPDEGKSDEGKSDEGKSDEGKSDEGKSDEGKSDDAKDKDGEDDGDKEGAPEEYADFVMPEGIEVDEKAVERFSPIFKELNLSQEQAQKLVDAQAEALSEAAQGQIKEWMEVRENWLETAKSDEEVGGDKFTAALEDAGAAIREYGTPELVEAMDQLGIGNHPELIRFMARVGKDVSDDTVRGGNSPQSAGMSIAQKLYPSMNK